MLVQFGNNWIKKIPLKDKFWLFSEFLSSNYFKIGQHVVLLHILIDSEQRNQRNNGIRDRTLVDLNL